MDINIRPTTGVYATYRRLNYKPWYALAEFVDNSTQNFFDHRRDLMKVWEEEGVAQCLVVEITYDLAGNRLVVRDNAHGMVLADFKRSLTLDSPPADPSGRSEYGMGLKTAACWFGARWTVETTALGSNKLYIATVDVPKLAASHSDVVTAQDLPAVPEAHYTVVTIEQLYKPLRGRTLERIRDQLGSMYREDLRSGQVRMLWNGSEVSFEEQPILVGSRPDGTEVAWKKHVEFVVPWEKRLLPVRGWIGIRKEGRQRDAGLVLLRRGRVIVGGPGEGYRPIEVFGAPNMFRSQRLLGELHMNDWPVTQAKDGFDWAGGLEDAFIEALQEVCREYGEYADSYRQPRIRKEISFDEMERISRPTAAALSKPEFKDWLSTQIEAPDEVGKDSEVATQAEELRRVSSGPLVFEFRLNSTTWVLRLRWQDELADGPWMQVEYPSATEIEVYLNTGHPYLSDCLDDEGVLENVQRFAVCLALAEKLCLLASEDGRVRPSEFRVRMSRILRYVAETGENPLGAAAGSD